MAKSSEVLTRLLSRKVAEEAPFTPKPDLQAGANKNVAEGMDPWSPEAQKANELTNPGSTPGNTALINPNEWPGAQTGPRRSLSDKAINLANSIPGAANREIDTAKPMLEQAGTALGAGNVGGAMDAVKPYFKGLGDHPGDWAAAHPIGTGVGLAGGIGAAMLLNHLLSRKKRKPIPKMASDVMPSDPYEAIKGVVAPAMKWMKDKALPVANKVIRHPATTGTALVSTGAAADRALTQKSTAPAPTPVGTPAPDATKPAEPGILDSIKSGWNGLGTGGQVATVGAGLGAAALLAHVLSKPSQEDADSEEE